MNMHDRAINDAVIGWLILAIILLTQYIIFTKWI